MNDDIGETSTKDDQNEARCHGNDTKHPATDAVTGLDITDIFRKALVTPENVYHN